MRNLKTVFVLALLLSTTSVMADSASSTEAGVFDQELPDGMTISQTLNEWDRSAMRYHSEPPVIELEEDNAKAKDDASQS